MHSEPVPRLEKDDIYHIVHAHVHLSLAARRIVVVLYILDTSTLHVLVCVMNQVFPILSEMPSCIVDHASPFWSPWEFTRLSEY